MRLEEAEKIAIELRETLSPSCLRIAIAGSIRRRKPAVKDIELVAIPRFASDPESLFGDEKISALEWAICRSGKYEFDTEMPRNGDKYKRLRFKGMAVDLFIVTPETWGVQLLIRTGPAEFSHRFVMSRSNGGYLPEGMKIAGGRLWDWQSPLDTPEEKDVFRAIGLKYIEPEKRR